MLSIAGNSDSPFIATTTGVHLATHSHVAHELLVAHGLVGFVDGSGTGGRHAVAVAGVAATVVVATEVACFQTALVRTARALRKNRPRYPFIITVYVVVARNRRWPSCTCDGLQMLLAVNLHGGSSGGEYLLCGKQHASLQSSSHPQSHSSPGSTTPLPQIDVCGSAQREINTAD